jgi:hypothetical protein
MAVMQKSRWISLGLFASTFATLLLEIADSRLLSVVTWYHLSFLAVSLAMLGMAAGAVRVFLSRAPRGVEDAIARLPGMAIAFAMAIAASHLINLCIPIPSLTRFTVMEVVTIAAATAVLAVPFYFSGVLVTVALTRTGGDIGRLYAWDLAGAATACLAIGPLLDSGALNLSSLVLLAAAAAAFAGFCFAQATASAVRWRAALTTGVLAAAALINGSRPNGIEVAFPKNRSLWMATDTFAAARWNSHSYVILQYPVNENVFYWGPGKLAAQRPARIAWMAIDGEAGTPITEWDGNQQSLDWVKHDVTTLPYHLRRGSAAVIGVGGGRDVLSAIWGGNKDIVGIEVNSAPLDFLGRKHRTFAKISTRPGVQLVHDDARSYLTRSPARFDVIQMSLIDTWAATGAGAFTLSENGLYTVEGWKVFLGRLTPNGVFSVSRWFAPDNVSETNRLLALAVATLQDLGASRPLDHLLLVSRGRTATLLTSRAPFTAGDEAMVRRIAAEEEFTVQVAPSSGGSSERLDRIARSVTRAELDAATEDPQFDYSPPTDRRPFFFNMLKPGSFTHIYSLPRGGVMWGNMRATATLILLFVIATVLVVAIIAAPLVASGWPAMPRRAFAAALIYFATIGLAFMCVQIALLQRFSVFLGHPAYTFSVTLFAMILFAGAGSYLSDRVAGALPRPHVLLPLTTALAIGAAAAAVGPVTAATIGAALPVRIAVVVAFLAPIATLLGFFFPAGMRAVARLTGDAAAWMWGVNGAFGVLGSIIAVGVSLWVGIQTNLIAAALLYAALVWPLAVLNAAAEEAAPAGTRAA